MSNLILYLKLTVSYFTFNLYRPVC